MLTQPMTITCTNVQNNVPIKLYKYIQAKKIAIKSVSRLVGYYHNILRDAIIFYEVLMYLDTQI